MRKIEGRLAALETAAVNSSEAQYRAAHSRLHEIMRREMPEIKDIEHQVQTHPAGFQTVVDVKGVKFGELLFGLMARIESSALTVDDHRVLTALTVDDVALNTLNCTALEFIVRVGVAWKQFEELY